MSEKYYDDVIAPKLLEVGRLCLDNGLSLVARVEWPIDAEQCTLDGDDEGCGVTAIEQLDASLAHKITEWASKCGGNVDALIFQILPVENQRAERRYSLQRVT